MMNNRQLADTFTLIGNLLEIKGEIIYKTLAYRKASESLMGLGREASEYWKEGKLETPAYVTVLHNGVLVQNHRPLFGGTTHRQIVPYKDQGPKGQIGLQDHGNPVRYRNVWVRELKPVDSE